MKLHALVEQFIAYRQALGERFHHNAAYLRAFCRVLGKKLNVTMVTPAQVSAFIDGRGPVTRSWHCRYTALRGFYAYALSRGYVSASPMPTIVPKESPRAVPYIYTPEELRRLVRATDSYQRGHSSLEPLTMRTILLSLYGMGLRVGEILRLDHRDVDLTNNLLTIRETKFFKTRWVPFGPQLAQILAQYSTRSGVSPAAVPFFTMRTGARIKKVTLNRSFQCLRRHANIKRTDGAWFQPRLHDMRHSFAVHRLTQWYRQGADVQRLVYNLSVYLGHTSLDYTQVYLTMTPELLQIAGTRFERYAREEKKHE
jgi:site-specific recombinase XerD